MIRFETVSGSFYEVDQDNKSVRRLIGVNDPTPRQGPDGEWREYTAITDIVPGLGVLIVWRVDEEDGEPIARSTVTSAVKEIRLAEAN
jgi:hypothetical protein